MKKLLYIILLLPLWVNAQTNGTIQKTSATSVIRGNFGSLGLDTLVKKYFIDVRNYASISAAITAIGSAKATLLIPNAQTVSSSVTIPSNVVLQVQKEALITISSGQTLTINGDLDAGLYQIFAGSGTVVFQRGSIELAHPEWWYTGSGTWHTAINQAMVATAEKGIPVQLSGKTYATTGTITVGADNVLQGVQGRYTGTVIDYSGSTSAVTVADDYNFGTVKKIAITGGTTATSIGILVARPYTLVEDVFIYDFAGEAGIKVTDSASTSGGYLSRLNRITIYGNAPGVAALGDLKFGVWFSSQANAVSLSEFSANYVGTSGGAGIYIDGGVGISIDNANVENGYSGSFTVHGILVNGGSAITLHDPYFENNNKNLVVNNGSAVIIDNMYANGYGQSSVGLQINSGASNVTVKGGNIASIAGTGTDIELVGSPTGVQIENVVTDDATYTGTPLINFQSASKLELNGVTKVSSSATPFTINRTVNGGLLMPFQISGVDKSYVEANVNDGGSGAGTAFNLRNNQGAVGLYDNTNNGIKISGGIVTMPTPFTLGATSVTTTGTQLNYLNAATGTTGTTSTNLVFSTSPTLVTPTIGAAIFTTLTGGTASSVSWANTSAGNVTNSMSIRNGGTTTGTGNGVNFVTGTSLNSARINNVLTSATEGDLVFSTMTASTLAEAGRFLSDKTLSLAAGITGTTATFSGGLKWGASTFESGLAKLYTDATYGVNLVSKTGSSTDFLLLTPSGGQILSVPTGTTNVSIAGTVSASNLVSGTYTPTLTNGTNVSSSSANAVFHYIRVGNEVTVEGSVTINFSAAGDTVFDISLPIASNFSGIYQLNGSGINNAPSIAGSAICRADTTNDRMSMNFAALSTNGLEYVIRFTYTII